MPNNLLDWTITHAPEPDEPPLPPASDLPEETRPISWRVWLKIGIPALAAMLGLWLFLNWEQNQRLKRELAQVVAVEDQAALARDTDALTQAIDPSVSTTWLAEQIRQIKDGQAAPLPIPILWPAPEAGRVQSAGMAATDTVRADVVRQFIAPDGSAVRFALPQYYRRAGNTWKRTSPPDAVWGERRERRGKYLVLKYYPVDAAFVDDLAPYLENVLGEACAIWREACPPRLQLQLDFDRPTPSSYYYVRLYHVSRLSDGPLLFALMPSSPSGPLTGPLSMLSPHAVGYPADEASADLLKRAMAVWLLAQTANRLVGEGVYDHQGNAFLYALVARMAARLGVETPNALQMFVTPAPFSVGEARDLDASLGWRRDLSLPLHGALAVLNVLLKDQPAETEARLFHSLRTAPHLTAWLSGGLGISQAEAQARLLAAMENPPVGALGSSPKEFVLSCRGGPAFFARGEAKPTPILSGYLPNTHLGAWSPDGRRLILSITGRPAVVDFAAGEVIWLPKGTQNIYGHVQWTSNTVIAYTVWPSPTGNTPQPARLKFFDAADPGREFPDVVGIEGYALSPDKSTAAIVQSGHEDSPAAKLGLMPAPGGPITPLGEGALPTWSPDGKALSYVRFDENHTSFSLHIVEVDTGLSRQILSSDDLSLDGPAPSPRQGFADVRAAWSPTGEQIAFSASSATYDGYFISQVGIVSTDGANLKVLIEAEEETFFFPYSDLPPAFSADGQLLTATFYHGSRSATTTVYDVTSGEPGVTFSHVATWASSPLAWSPSGHQLALSAPGGLYLISEPGNPQSQWEKLVGDECQGVQWNPTP